MGEARRHIEDVQKQTNSDEVALDLARTRRTVVFDAAETFPGMAGTYASGSVAAGVVTGEVEDADGGAKADRRCFPALGPDGDGAAPQQPVEDLQAHIGPIVRDTCPDAVVRRMKRGLRVFFNDPLPDGQDPYVDLVFALTRRDAPGLWIPNMASNTWDAAHPEKHVELLTAGSKSLRRTRAQVIRLAKVWNKQWSQPAFNSFNLCALALEVVTASAPIDDALAAFVDHAAVAVAVRRTEDPAGVSGPINLEQPKEIAVARLRDARDALHDALDHDDDAEHAQRAMHRLFFGYVPDAAEAISKESLAARLRAGTPRLRTTAAGLAVAGAVKPMRSFGGRRG
jgi:hypothetical protein